MTNTHIDYSLTSVVTTTAISVIVSLEWKPMLLCVCVSQLRRPILRVYIFVGSEMGVFWGQAGIQVQRSRSRLLGASESRMNSKLMERPSAKWTVASAPWRIGGRKNGGEIKGNKKSGTIKRWTWGEQEMRLRSRLSVCCLADLQMGAVDSLCLI